VIAFEIGLAGSLRVKGGLNRQAAKSAKFIILM
jgi:hypothetical protein